MGCRGCWGVQFGAGGGGGGCGKGAAGLPQAMGKWPSWNFLCRKISVRNLGEERTGKDEVLEAENDTSI